MAAQGRGRFLIGREERFDRQFRQGYIDRCTEDGRCRDEGEQAGFRGELQRYGDSGKVAWLSPAASGAG